MLYSYLLNLLIQQVYLEHLYTDFQNVFYYLLGYIILYIYHSSLHHLVE